MISRRAFVTLALGIVAVPFAAEPQRPGKVVRIGFPGAATPTGYAPRVSAFRRGMKELGYVEGKDHVIEFRWAYGKYERLPELAAELGAAQT